jgi:hypothetical protein
MINTAAGTPVGSATPSSVCLGNGPVVLNVTSGEAGTGGSWVWYASNKTTKVTTTLTPSVTETYYVRSEGAVCGTGAWSSGVIVTVKTRSTDPNDIDISKATPICSGSPITLTIKNGSLGTNAQWYWYTNSSFINPFAHGTATSRSVSPTSTTTYYVRGEGDCNNTTAVSRTIDVYDGLTVTGPNSASGCASYIPFTVIPSGSTGYTYQWQISTDNGSTYTDILEGGKYYSGSTTETLSAFANPSSSTASWFRCIVSDGCGKTDTSWVGVLTINCP